jgi:polyferredoxin|uniref:Cardiolipin synthase N-terminal domain-containing protein n=1 Tax=viral metagenome TaxID=1070528 RepID=A0A6C0AHI3_9ZZZZ|tara:strand:+ start:15955 stop:16194 length:240 start_codon:yes stop_codon:yes gene_type:complete
MTEYLIHFSKKNDNNTKENFNSNNTNKFLYVLIWLIHLAIGFLAIYLSFKRNNGFNIKSFLLALFFPIIYIAYAFAVPV